MPILQGQQAYGIMTRNAQPGQLADLTHNIIRSFQAIEVIQPGVAVEIAADGVSVQQVQGTCTGANSSYQTGGGSAALVTGRMLGISVLRTFREGSGAVGITPYGVGGPQYNIGDMVPVLMFGSIFAAYLPNGVAQPAWASGTFNASSTGYIQVAHSTTVPTNRGMFTTAQANGTTTFSPAGANVTSRYNLGALSPVILIDFNFTAGI